MSGNAIRDRLTQDDAEGRQQTSQRRHDEPAAPGPSAPAHYHESRPHWA